MPSADEATDFQRRLLRRGVHVLPESLEVKIRPLPIESNSSTATSLTPSADDATDSNSPPAACPSQNTPAGWTRDNVSPASVHGHPFVVRVPADGSVVIFIALKLFDGVFESVKPKSDRTKTYGVSSRVVTVLL